MRLLHVIQRYYPFQGGSERYFGALSERFAASGAAVQVVTSDAWDLEYFWDPAKERIAVERDERNGVAIRRVPVRHLPAARLSHQALRRLMAESSRLPLPGRDHLLWACSRFGPWLPELSTALEESAPVDVIHSANVSLESMIGAAAAFARDRDLPHLVTPFVHLGDGPRSRVRRYYTMPHQIELLRRADAVMTLTALEAEALVRAGVPEWRLHVVGAGIDIAAATGGDAARAKEQLGIDGPLVLGLGAVAFEKGSHHLVQAVRRLRREGEAVTLALAGPIVGDFAAFWERLAPQDRRGILVLGFVSEAEKRDLLAAADVLALPSRTESFGLVFHEAWANGKPVVGARAGAIPDVVSDGENGILVDYGDVECLVQALGVLVREPALRRRLGEAGRAAVVDEAVWFERVRAVYAQVTGVSRPTKGEPVESIG